jgi:DnaJ-class molecular chaperone
MSTVTSGLKKKSESIVSIIKKPVNCHGCEGTGNIEFGGIETEKGTMDLFDTCGTCDGSGQIIPKLRKIKRKSRVEML